MASTSYRPVYWGNEPTTSAKLNQMVNNTQWVYENMPRMLYTAYGIKKTAGVKILAGTVIAPATGDTYSEVDVSFGSFFTPGCKPVVVASFQPTSGKQRFHIFVKGIGRYQPDHRGARLRVMIDYYGTPWQDNKVTANSGIHYIAVGW